MNLIESDIIELKESWTEDAMSDLAAFANTRGGTLYIGVRDSGEIRGCDVSDDIQKRIGSKILNSLQIGADIQVITGDTPAGPRHALAIGVKPSRTPVLLRGSYWTRVGTISTKAPPEQWANLVLTQTGQSWDALPARGATLDDIDVEALQEFLRKATARSDSRLSRDIAIDNTDPMVLLHNLKLLANGQITNAAVMLFGRKPSDHFFQARIRIARFPGGTDRIVDYPEVRGTVFQQIDGAMRLLEEHMPYVMSFPEGPPGKIQIHRHEEQIYPSWVAREAICNAVIHRDYLEPGSEVQVRILDDQFHIWNPGGLMPPLTVENLYQKPHKSARRNPLIAQIAFYAHVIEAWGTGTTRMVEGCKAHGLPLPEFETNLGFTTVLRRSALTQEVLEQLELNTRQIKAMLTAGVGGALTNVAYRTLTGTTESTAARDIQDLEQKGLVERTGTGRATRYVVRMPGLSTPPRPPQ